MKFSAFFITSFFCFVATTAQKPVVGFGIIHHIEKFPSRYVDARNIDVWLPPGYDSTKKYAVLYMNDGQMVFDSSITWNHAAWDVDDVLEKLYIKNEIKPVIVVAIWNGNTTRHADYFPQKPFESLSKIEQDNIYTAVRASGASVFNGYAIHSDNYLKFVVKELKPFIDKRYSTLAGKKNTFIMGSSMGALISIYAICEYPDVFGGVACLSTHWPGIFTMQNNNFPFAFENYLMNNLPDARTHKIYFDHGTATLDSMYQQLQEKVDTIMVLKGYQSKNWVTKEFPGANHSERAWHDRLDIPLLFLLKK